jgi:hypothetical protein
LGLGRFVYDGAGLTGHRHGVVILSDPAVGQTVLFTI